MSDQAGVAADRSRRSRSRDLELIQRCDELGVGPGALVSDAVMMGIEPVTQRPRMDESLGVIIRLLAGEVVTHTSDCEARRPPADAAGQRVHADRRGQHDDAGRDGVRGHHGVGVLSLGAGLIGGRKDLAAQWEMGQRAAAAAGGELRRSDWRLVIRAHLAESREEAIAAVRTGRERERDLYDRRVAGMRNETTLEEEIEQDTSIIGTPDDMIAALHRLHGATGGFGGFMVLAKSRPTSGRTAVASVQPCSRAAVQQAYRDAGEPVPDDLDPARLR